MWKNTYPILENFIKINSNYTYPICEKALKYEGQIMGGAIGTNIYDDKKK